MACNNSPEQKPPVSFHPSRGDGSAPVKRERAQALRREMTAAERVLWVRLRTFRARGFPFRRQQVIGGFIADFYCHPAGLIIEVDGPVHATQSDYDAERDQILMGYQLRILRITNDDVLHRLPEVIARIETALGLSR